MSNFNDYLFILVYQGTGYWPLLDRFFIILTSYAVYVVLLALLVYVLGVHPLKGIDVKAVSTRFKEGGEVALSLFLTSIVVYLVKIFVALPRPFVALAQVTPLIDASPYQSFPSGHAALTMAAAIAVLPYHKHLGHLLIAFSLVIALSRLYVGVHYPFDVGVGLLIGYLVPKIIHRFSIHKKAA